MSTRATSAAHSNIAKQRLIALLSKYSETTATSVGSGEIWQNHCSRNTTTTKPPAVFNDFESRSYDELRVAYLKSLQQLHPDKRYASHHHQTQQQQQQSYNHQSRTPPTLNENEEKAIGRREEHHAFIELQDAWNKYEKMTKCFSRVGLGKGGSEKDLEMRKVQQKFTMFGVGCSFADSPSESQRRREFMDQACRGWLSAGLLSDATKSTKKGADNATFKECNNNDTIHNNSTQTSLIEDDLFVLTSDCGGGGHLRVQEPLKQSRGRSLIDCSKRQ